MTIRHAIGNLLAVCAIACLSACETLHAEPDVAAVIVAPDEQSRAELRRIVGEIAGTQATIAADALTQSSWLILEQTPPGNITSGTGQGRNMSTPMRLQLVRNGSDCVLVDRRNGDRHKLGSTNCSAE